jgi:hypothetical protein
MSPDSNNRAKLLYKEKGNERLNGVKILILAILLSITVYTIFLLLLSALDEHYPGLNIMKTYWWVLPFALFIVPSVAYIYSLYLICKGKGPIKIYKHGIQIRSSFIYGETKNSTFIPYESILKISLLYGGYPKSYFGMNLNELHIIGLRIRTIEGFKYDINTTFYTKNYGFFSYDLIQIIINICGDKWNKWFSVEPDIDDNEWETLLQSSKGFLNRIGDYSIKITIYASIMTIPMFITMVLMMMDILNGMSLYSMTFITTFIGFTTLSFSTEFIFSHLERTELELGALYRAQEYEMLTGEKIIPKDLKIPDDFIYPGEDWPNFDKAFWDKLRKFSEPKSRLDKWQYSNWYRQVIRETVVKIIRYEDLTGKNLIPSHIRNMEEVGDLREWGEGSLDEMSSIRRVKELQFKKRNILFEDLERGRSVTQDLEFKSTCFKKYP